MLGVPMATWFVALAALCFILAFFSFTVLGHALRWPWLAAACLCAAWMAGGELFR